MPTFAETPRSPRPIRRLSASMALLFLLVPFSAHGASVTTDIDIDLPSIVILSCFDQIDVSITAANLASLLVGAPATGDEALTTPLGTVTPSVVGTDLEGNPVTLDTSLSADPSSIFLNLLGVCGVRAIGNGGGVDVSIVGENLTLAGPSGSIVVDSVRTRRGGGAAFGPSFNIADANLGLGNVNLVDVQLELDLADARQAGDYSSPAAGTFTITAVAP
ncbi:MAG: hypothetical protein AAGM22_21810 [Acidobacteriota bacterium]